MKKQLYKVVTSAALLLAVVVVSSWIGPARVQADDEGRRDNDRQSRVEIGFKIAPVPLNLKKKDPDLVGYGSYLVNATGDCNGCHSPGPQVEYKVPGNPYFGQKAVVNPAVYLSGGQSFGSLIPGSAEIISRNLTPDKTGRPAGGITYQEFREIIKHGTDFDHLHPTCSGAPGPNCIPPPFDGSLLQVMPWPSYSHMNEADLEAIYAYLSAIPCIAGPPAPSTLHNECN